MKITEARYKANKKYDSKAYKRINVCVRKDSPINHERIKAEADKAGESINRFILEAIRQRIEK